MVLVVYKEIPSSKNTTTQQSKTSVHSDELLRLMLSKWFPIEFLLDLAT